jgi:beta-mannosidase
MSLETPAVAAPARFIALQELPTWNKTVLDTSIGRALERADPSRPVVRHSGVLPGPVAAGTDSHLYFGWYHGEERDLPRLLATVPRLARFVGEFGAQAVPSTSAWMEPERWPDLDWDALEAHHALQLDAFARYVPPASFATFDAWAAATQAYQAEVIRYHAETLRRLKYRPCGGFCQFLFADAQPAVSWSVLDHARVPKTGYAALAAACAPVIVVADRPEPSYRAGDVITLDVHVVSDLRRALEGARVIATLGDETVGWDGDIPADSCVKVGTVRTPATVSTALCLRLEASDVNASASYPIVVTQP